jgi:REP element-mobilizing transposase RayT
LFLVTLFNGTYRIESTRLRHWDYGSPGWYFVTICTQNRECLFGEIVQGQVKLSPAGTVVQAELRNVPSHYSNVIIDASVVMPNHLHAIIVIDGPHQFSPWPSPSRSGESLPSSQSLSSIVRSFKSGVTYRWRRLGIECAWQARFYEHILRGNASVNAVRDYIQNNPLNWDKDQENHRVSHQLTRR